MALSSPHAIQVPFQNAAASAASPVLTLIQGGPKGLDAPKSRLEEFLEQPPYATTILGVAYFDGALSIADLKTPKMPEAEAIEKAAAHQKDAYDCRGEIGQVVIAMPANADLRRPHDVLRQSIAMMQKHSDPDSRALLGCLAWSCLQQSVPDYSKWHYSTKAALTMRA